MIEKNCLFCKIISGQIPSRKIYETENTVAFLDIMPVSKGHTIIIPKNHYCNLLDIPKEEIQPFFTDLKKIAQMLKNKLNLDGFNIVQNNFPAAGQVINHFHFHIWPRMENDSLSKIQRKPELASEESLDELHKILLDN